MDKDGNGSSKTFEIPEDPRAKAVWLRHWISSLFKVYLSITDHAAVAMPYMKFGQMEKEAEAVKAELLKLITPEKWEKEHESGKHKV